MIRNFARYARRVFVPGAVVLVYHRVACHRSDPWRLCVSPERFSEQMTVLRSMHPLSLSELVRCMNAGRLPRRAIVVTFDDGYADNFDTALPILSRHSIPATIFVVSGHVGAGREFWWDELERVLLQTIALPERLELRIGDRTFTRSIGPSTTEAWTAWEPQEPGSRQALYCELWAQLQPMPHCRRLAVLNELLRWAHLSPLIRPEYRALEARELIAMTSGELIEIGAHSSTHSRLSSLSVDQLEFEVVRAKADLERELGRPIRSFAYPYGHCTDIGAYAPAIVAEAGFTCACSNLPALVEAGTDPYLLPRFHVENWAADEFQARVQSWLAWG